MRNWDDVLASLNAAHRRVASSWTGMLTSLAILAAPFFIVFNHNVSSGWVLIAFAAAAVWIYTVVSHWAWRVGPAHPYVRFCFLVCLFLVLDERRRKDTYSPR